MIPDQIRLLTERYLHGNASEEEAAALHSWYDAQVSGDTELVSGEIISDREVLRALMQENIERAVRADGVAPVRRMINRRFLLRLSAAAVFILLAGLVAYWLPQLKESGSVSIKGVVNDVAPGYSGAVLTLADGRTVVLDSVGNGLVAVEKGVQVMQSGAKLTYSNSGAEGAAGWNMLATPVGRQYMVVLPDGTRVWLNAASSLRFPTIFGGDVREVVLMGEGYFEVAPGRQRFRVRVREGMEVQVLGTHFNVNAYENELSVRTTLMQGKVKVIAANSTIMLEAGQQAFSDAGWLRLAPSPDLQQVIAWKDGYFQFNHADLPSVLRELTRWYDVDVRYEGNVPRLDFGGAIGRDLSLAQVLKVLQQSSNARLRIEGRTLVVNAP